MLGENSYVLFKRRAPIVPDGDEREIPARRVLVAPQRLSEVIAVLYGRLHLKHSEIDFRIARRNNQFNHLAVQETVQNGHEESLKGVQRISDVRPQGELPRLVVDVVDLKEEIGGAQ